MIYKGISFLNQEYHRVPMDELVFRIMSIYFFKRSSHTTVTLGILWISTVCFSSIEIDYNTLIFNSLLVIAKARRSFVFK